MLKFNSKIKCYIYSYINYQKSSQRYTEIGYGRSLKNFDTFCTENYLNENILTQEMIDIWCLKKDTETNTSRNSRVRGISSFIKYLNDRKLTNLKLPEKLIEEKNAYIPHAFKNNELTLFFSTCDNYSKNSKCDRNKLILPIIFRLLYSSGLRTVEVRKLKLDNINFETGVVSVEESKGYDQHYIVLHDTMLSLLKDYNNEINKLYPNRVYLFPNCKNTHLNQKWLYKYFKKFWYKNNESRAVVYDFRHNYAIENINSWKNTTDFYKNLLYLSKSMGHASIESTKRYYSLVPKIANLFDDATKDTLNYIIPEVQND